MREFREFCGDFEKKAADAELEKEALSPALLQRAADKAGLKGLKHTLMSKVTKSGTSAGKAKSRLAQADKFQRGALKKERLRKGLGAPVHSTGEGYAGSIARSADRGIDSVKKGIHSAGTAISKRLSGAGEGVKGVAASLARRGRMLL